MEFYKINKRISFVLAFVILFSSIFIFPTNVEAAEGVTTVAKLQDAVNTATEGEVITLADEFTFGDATLTVPNVNVTIDGGDKIWNSGTITVSGADTGSLTIKNLKMDGTSEKTDKENNKEAKRLLTNSSTNGTLILENMEFYGANEKGAIYIATSAGAKTVINKVHIHDIVASTAGPAIYLEANSNLDINNSTIEKISGTQGGYECGPLVAGARGLADHPAFAGGRF